MGRLPNEIMANIISCLAAEGSSDDYGEYIGDDNARVALAPYATVSRGWQQRVEATTFAHITLTPVRLASPLAAQALTPDRVRRFVRTILVDVLLPPYDVQARAQCEDEADRAINDGIFTDVVRRLFALLAGGQAGQQHRAGVAAGYRSKIRRSLRARCVSDKEDLDKRLLRWPPADIFERRYDSSYLDLRPAAGKSVQDEVEALPELHCIQDFNTRAPSHYGHLYFASRHFAPRILCLMASRMPRLVSIDWGLYDNEKRDAALRKGLRTDFAEALRALPSSLQRFGLVYHRCAPLDHSFQPPSILDGDHSDKLSLALHKLSQRLVTFNLIADVGPEVFWPLERTQDDDPFWPRMRRYHVNTGPIAPSGQWLFHRSDSDSDSDDASNVDSFGPEESVAPGDEKEDPFRSKLDRDAANALLLAAARAVRRMPALLDMSFYLDPPVSSERLEVEYMVEGGTVRRGGRGTTAQLVVETRPVFHPDEEVLRIWREAAEEYVDAESGLVVEVRDHGRYNRI